MATCRIVKAKALPVDDDPVFRADIGALCHDFVANTIDLHEFVDRIQTVLRSARGEPPPQLIIDAERRRVAMRGASVALTRQEFDLLYILSSRPGIVFSRQALLSKLPRAQCGATDRTIDAIVTRLRHKLGDDSRAPRFIFTVWGLGYKFADAEEG